MSLKFIKNVICILCVCYLIFLGITPKRFSSSKHEAVLAVVHLLQGQLIEFKHETGYLPKTLEAAKCVSHPYNSNKSCTKYIRDPWEEDIIYIYPAKYGNLEFDLYSKGADGKDDFGKNDDISNWNGINYWVYNKKLMIEQIILGSVLFSLFICFLSSFVSLFIGKKQNTN